MQSIADKQLADGKELSLSSSSSSSASTHEDRSSWGDTLAPPVPSRLGRPSAVSKRCKDLNTMASGQNNSLDPLEDPNKRISNATVFESMSVLGEGLTEIRKQPLSCTASMPLADNRQIKMPAPPPDMDDIE